LRAIDIVTLSRNKALLDAIIGQRSHRCDGIEITQQMIPSRSGCSIDCYGLHGRC
jgi:hypothetical protein